MGDTVIGIGDGNRPRFVCDANDAIDDDDDDESLAATRKKKKRKKRKTKN